MSSWQPRSSRAGSAGEAGETTMTLQPGKRAGGLVDLRISGGEYTSCKQRGCSGSYSRWLSSGRTSQRARCILDRKSTRLNSSHRCISYAVFCLKKKKKKQNNKK